MLPKTPIILAKPPAERVSEGRGNGREGGRGYGMGAWPTHGPAHLIQQAKAAAGPAPPPPGPAPPIVLMKARGEEGRGGGGAGDGAAVAPPREREGPRPTQPVYQLHGRGLPPPGAMDREWEGLTGGAGLRLWLGWRRGRGQR